METKKLFEIKDKLRGHNLTLETKLIILELYLLKKSYPELFENWTKPYTSSEHRKLIDQSVLQNDVLLHEDIKLHLDNLSNLDVIREELFKKLQAFEINDLENFLVDESLGEKHFYDSTPKSIIDLAIKLFGESTKGKPTLDLCSGTGNFLYNAKNHNMASQYFGVEINRESYLLSLLKMEVGKSVDYQIINKSVFEPIDFLTKHSNIKFSSIFSNFPFGLRIRESEKPNLKESYQTKNDLPLQRRNTSDYSFISLMLRNLDKEGKAIAVIPGGALFNNIDQDIREYMIKKGLIEAVLELPTRMFYQTSIKTYMLVLSFNNKNVKFVNLSGCIKQELRNVNILDVDKAYDIVSEEKQSRSVAIVNSEKIKENRFSLVPLTYLDQDSLSIKNAISLKELAEIFTGWQVSSSQLDKRYVKEEKNDEITTRIIQLSDINEGVIDKNSNLYTVDSRQINKFSVQNGDVLISTKSRKVKSAVVEIEDDESFIASGSIMVIRVNTSKMDPYYLRAFLDSPIGQKLLAMKQTGNVIPNLTVNSVKTLKVPFFALEKQKNIAANYKDKFMKIQFEKKRLEKLENEIDSLFDFVTEGEQIGK